MTRKQITIGVVVALAIAVVVLFFIFNPFFSTTSSTPLNTAPLTSGSSSSLVIQDIVAGAGVAATAGDLVTVNFTGKLENGTVFDTSVGKNPYKFVLGSGTVIPGWDEGLVGMKVGGKRVLVVPPSLGYGAQGMGPIPPNATLTFEIELVKVDAAGSFVIPEGANF